MGVERRGAGRQWQKRQTDEKKIGIVPKGLFVPRRKPSKESQTVRQHLRKGAERWRVIFNSKLLVRASDKTESQLESRMREICQSGSGGGAAYRSYLITRFATSFSRTTTENL